MLRTMMTLSIVALGPGTLLLAQDLPPNVVAKYVIYEDPNDVDSDILMDVQYHLAPYDRDGDDVTWEFVGVTVREYIGGVLVKSWSDDLPDVDTVDGYWTVTHDNPEKPSNDDFVVPPLVEGTGSADFGTTTSLDYSVLGALYSPPVGGPHFSNATGRLDYIFGHVPQPLLDDDGPVWIEPIPVDPVW